MLVKLLDMSLGKSVEVECVFLWFLFATTSKPNFLHFCLTALKSIGSRGRLICVAIRRLNRFLHPALAVRPVTTVSEHKKYVAKHVD